MRWYHVVHEKPTPKPPKVYGTFRPFPRHPAARADPEARRRP